MQLVLAVYRMTASFPKHETVWADSASCDALRYPLLLTSPRDSNEEDEEIKRVS